MEIAYDQSGRAQEIDEAIEFLAVALQQVQLTGDFPNGLSTPQLDFAQSAALSLCATICDYIALAIQYMKRPVAGSL
jgi:hypothetical protein